MRYMLKTKNYEKLHPCERRTGAGNVFSIMKTIKIIAPYNIQLLTRKDEFFCYCTLIQNYFRSR